MSGLQFLFVYTFAAFGVCYAVGHAKISLGIRARLAQFNVVRPIVEFIECPACLGFWIGCAAGRWWLEAPLDTSIVLGLFTMAVNFCIGRATGIIPHPRSTE